MAADADNGRGVAVVTGAGRGIGAATVRALADAGWRVAVAARRLEDAERVAADVGGAQAAPFRCDVADPAAGEHLMATVAARFGEAPRAFVNNAGTVAPIGLLHETDAAEFAANIAATLTGAALMARAALPGMLAAGGGTIVNLSSGAAHRPLEGWSAYCAAKAGLAMLTRSLHLEYAGRGIRAFGFAPGLVDTGMQAAIRASGLNPVSRMPQESLAPASEPARAIAFLLTPAADGLAGGELDIRDRDFRCLAGLAPV